MAQQNYQRVSQSSLRILVIALLSVLAGATAALSSHSPQTVANGLPSGETLSGSVAWSASASDTPNRVTFSIDGTVVWTERHAPFMFDGDGSKLDTSALANGPHTFTVTAYPTRRAGGAVSASVTDAVFNGPAPLSPVKSTTLPVISGPPIAGGSLTATSGTWSGTTPIAFNYQWMLCDKTGDNCTTSLSGSSTYLLTSAAQGLKVRVTVTASNPAGSGSASSEATTVVTPSISAPSVTAPPVVSGNRVVGQTLTTTEGSWTGAAPIAYLNRWQRCDESGTSCSDISGATGTTYGLQAADATHTIRVIVTASNALGASAARSAVLGPVVLAPPPVTTTTTVTPPSTTTTTATTTTPAKTTTPTTTAPSPPPAPSSPPPAGGIWAWAAARGTLDANSASKVAAFQSYAVAKGSYFEAAVAWVNAPAGTPSYTVPITGQAITSITAPIPVGTKPGSTFDQSLTVFAANGTEYDFGLAQYDSSTGKIKSTDGAATVAPGAAYETGPNSANAARFPLGAGPITPADIKAGVINHPLVFSMPNVGPAPNPYPANTTVGYPGNSGLPLGSWLRLDPSVNVAALGLPPLETEIATALQKYGMFLRDIGSTVCIIATDQVNQGGNAVDWPAVGVNLTSSTPSGVPYARSLNSNFPWNKLQLLQPPSS